MVAPPLRARFRRWRREVHDPRCEAGEAGQGGAIVQVAAKRRDAALPESCFPLDRRGERQDPHPAAQAARHPHAHIAAADDEEPLAAEARRQRAEGTLV
jgi:hypothetical protein